MKSLDDGARFEGLFARWAGQVRGRIAARSALTGLAVGGVVAAAAAAEAWRERHGSARLACILLAVVGGGIGLAIARRRRWTDVDVALWLDDRLDAGEAVTTAVELSGARARAREGDGAAGDTVRSNAAAVLAGGRARDVGPRVLRPIHALAVVAAIVLAIVARAPLPPAPIVAHAPGDVVVQIAQAEGLKKVAQLAKAGARDEAQRQRLDDIAKDADKLRADLEKGLEKREALDRIARLRDAIAAEKLSLGDGERRAGLEAAISKLEQTDATRDAARALGDHDLERMDREMERLANAREKDDRESAKHALDDAAAAARSAGAPDVGHALEQEKKALEERERRAEALRDLEKAMEGAGEADDSQRSEVEALDRRRADADARKMADAMGKALEKLTPEQRERLASKLREMAKGGAQGDPQAMRDLADDLSTPEGQKNLEDRLRQMADADDEPGEARTQEQLDGAEQGAEGDEGRIQGRGDGQTGSGPGQGSGGVPVPRPGPGSGDGSGDGPGAGGHHHDTGTGSHEGHTGEVAGDTLRSRAHGPVGRAPGMPGAAAGWSPGNAGGTANVRGTGALGAAGPGEIDGVDHSDVPKEYRDQVRQYFQP